MGSLSIWHWTIVLPFILVLVIVIARKPKKTCPQGAEKIKAAALSAASAATNFRRRHKTQLTGFLPHFLPQYGRDDWVSHPQRISRRHCSPACPKCGRAGQYRKQNLIERYGADMRLPDLREEVA